MSIALELHMLAAKRRLAGEDKDPLMAMSEAILEGEEFPMEEMILILACHLNGLWVIMREWELEVFKYWCEKAGTPFTTNTPDQINGINIYKNDMGDCVVLESVARKTFAVWTRKSRLYIGFKFEADAESFRNKNEMFSVEKTGNKNVQLVVVDGGDNPETIELTTQLLKK